MSITLDQLRTSAERMGYRAEIIGTGGNVVALSLTVNGADALVSLGDGVEEGTDWSVSLDGATREQYGEEGADDLPVTSDADQTITDAAAWIIAQTSRRVRIDGEDAGLHFVDHQTTGGQGWLVWTVCGREYDAPFGQLRTRGIVSCLSCIAEA